MSGRDAEAAPTPGGQPDVSSLTDRDSVADPKDLADPDDPDDPADPDDEVETVILDRQWAREAPVHELSARGRTVQRRLQRSVGPGGTAGAAAPPSRWKRFRFWLFRLTRGR
ncbi:MAG: hypothetical protein ACXV3F_01795 [Frankiaceae bacterium]